MRWHAIIFRPKQRKTKNPNPPLTPPVSFFSSFLFLRTFFLFFSNPDLKIFPARLLPPPPSSLLAVHTRKKKKKKKRLKGGRPLPSKLGNQNHAHNTPKIKQIRLFDIRFFCKHPTRKRMSREKKPSFQQYVVFPFISPIFSKNT